MQQVTKTFSFLKVIKKKSAKIVSLLVHVVYRISEMS